MKLENDFARIKSIIDENKGNYIENAFSLDEASSVKENAFVIKETNGFKIIFESIEQFKSWIEC